MQTEEETAAGGRAAELRKACRRNEDAARSADNDLRANNPTAGTPHARGLTMWSRPNSHAATGNCEEQACVAAYLAVEEYRAAADLTYLVKVTKPGDHTFCVAGFGRRPAWPDVRSLVAGAPEFAVVIDPWMNLACMVRDYVREAEAKMNGWLGVGKRIWWRGNDGAWPGWYQPGGDYVARFLDSPLAYVPAK